MAEPKETSNTAEAEVIEEIEETEETEKAEETEGTEETKETDRIEETSENRHSSKINVFADWSNLYAGAMKNDANRSNLRVNVDSLCNIIFDERKLMTLVVGGSIPSQQLANIIGTQWSKVVNMPSYYNYYNPTIKFNFNASTKGELNIDDTIVTTAMYAVAGNNDTLDQTLVLVISDCNYNNGNRTSYYDVVQTALERQYDVEIWTWESCLSDKYNVLQKTFDKNLKIFYMNDYKDQFVFYVENDSTNTDRVNGKSPCKFYRGIQGSCKNGDKCTYNHNDTTTQNQPKQMQNTKKQPNRPYRTIPCKNFANGNCTYGDRCSFLHS